VAGQTTVPPLNSTTQNETYTGAANGTGGVLNTTGPNPSIVNNGGTGNTNYSKQGAQITNPYGTEKKVTKSAPGKINRLSVAVLVDGKSTSQATAMQRVVSAAVGLRTNRGDTIQVTRAAFDTSATKTASKELAAQAKAKQQQGLMSLIRTVGALLVAAFVLFLIWRSFKRAAPVRTPIELPVAPVKEIEAHAINVVDDEFELEEGAFAALESGPTLAEVENSPEVQQRLAITNELGELIDNQPDEVVQLLRGWLADRRS
jgi:flagellar M-ring protein FliF